MSIFTDSHAMLAVFFYVVFLSMLNRTKTIGLISNKIFRVIVLATNFNLTVNILLFFVYYYPEWFEPPLGVVINKIYVISVIWLICLHTLYIKVMMQKTIMHKSKVTLVSCVPTLVATVIIIFTEVGWYEQSNAINIIGIGIDASYAVSIFNILCIVYYNIKVWNKLTPKVKYAMKIGGLIWFICLVTQLYVDVFIDMISVTCVMTMFIYYFCFENTNAVIDEKSGLFNYEGFRLFASEMIINKKDFFVIDIFLDGLEYVRSQFGDEASTALLGHMEAAVNSAVNNNVFIYKDTNLLLIIYRDKKDEVIERINEIFKRDWNIMNMSIKIDAKILLLDSDNIEGIDEITDILNYTVEQHIQQGLQEKIMDIGIDMIERQKREQKILSLLQAAIANDGFDIFFQPIFDRKNNMFNSAEALIRVKDRETIGFISPEEFIPIAEQNGLIVQIGNIVFTKVCSFANRTKLWNYGVKYIEINLSAIQSVDAALPIQLNYIMGRYCINPNFINLEITETAAVNSEKQLSENMSALKKAGCTFSMDDFGTGYSNLSKVASMGYDIIKIDKSLIWSCFEEPDKDRALIILKNVVNMILQLGISIVAEGVETEEQSDYLLAIGIHHMQGYFYSRPIPEDEYISFISEKNKTDKNIPQ